MFDIKTLFLVICIEFFIIFFFIHTFKLKLFTYNTIFIVLYYIQLLMFVVSYYLTPELYLPYSPRIVGLSTILHLCGLIAYLFGYCIPLLLKFPGIKTFPNLSRKTLKKIAYIMFISSFISILIFATKTGSLVNISTEGKYELSYNLTVGSGYLTLLFPLFAPGILLWIYLKQRDKKSIFLSFSLIVLFGLLLFLITGGKRRFIVFALMYFFIFTYKNKIIKISFLHLIIFIAVTTFIMNILTFVRYGQLQMSELDSFLVMNIIYTVDSIAPYRSFLNILSYIQYNCSFQGLNLIFNHFLSLIPRFIWSDKPILILNTGNFYTQYILGYNSQLTISPTLIGELFLAYGIYSLLIGMLFTGIIISFIDRVWKSGKSRGIIYDVFFISNIGLIPGLVREGIEVFLPSFIIYYALFLMFSIIAKIKLPNLRHTKITTQLLPSPNRRIQ